MSSLALSSVMPSYPQTLIHFMTAFNSVYIDEYIPLEIANVAIKLGYFDNELSNEVFDGYRDRRSRLALFKHILKSLKTRIANRPEVCAPLDCDVFYKFMDDQVKYLQGASYEEMIIEKTNTGRLEEE
ncbi:hypothetical protein [Ramu stunt virus]|uniref:Uncharacterized protein n=1 Tax=Ramu stunt virus TaxID=1738604 RepID=A0A0N7IMX3_9VIRU|nr:hypothetical protein [Ramu stunt virus]